MDMFMSSDAHLATPELGAGEPHLAQVLQQRRLGLDVADGRPPAIDIHQQLIVPLPIRSR